MSCFEDITAQMLSVTRCQQKQGQQYPDSALSTMTPGPMAK